ncbi:MAG: hypothetical protein GEU90_09475 [Gemmatimonas sp.]|nr:hypothetical protein [Gemmatimonas sp.]
MRPIVREGFVAGILAAAAVALWFFGVDLVQGRPFGTPEVLGRGLFGLLYDDLSLGARTGVVLGYTVFHCLAFVLIGIAAATIVKRAEREPSILAGAVVLFVMLEVGFQLLLSMLGSIPVFGAVAWYNVAIGNVVAAITMGAYIWRAHPELKAEFVDALGGQS